jgi:hypothetical protein
MLSTPNLRDVTDDTAHYTSLPSFCLPNSLSLNRVPIAISDCQVCAFLPLTIAQLTIGMRFR